MIYNLPNIRPSNSYFTTEILVTALRSMLGDYGGDRLDTHDIRLWLNIGLTRAAAYIRAYAPKYYTVRWQATLTPEEYQGFDTQYGTVQSPYVTIDLSSPVQSQFVDYDKGEKRWPDSITPNGIQTSVVPYKYVCDVLSLQITHRYSTALPTFWMGLPEKVDMDKFAAIASGLNDHWRQDIIWTMQGHKIMVWAGSEVLGNPSVGQQNISQNWYRDSLVELTVLRKPILDDMISLDAQDPNVLISSNYTELADCPDEAVGLVLQYARETALGFLGKQEDVNAKQATMLMEQSLLTSLGHVQQQPQQ